MVTMGTMVATMVAVRSCQNGNSDVAVKEGAGKDGGGRMVVMAM